MSSKFNPETLKYVRLISKTIKHKHHSKDVAQDVSLILLEKNLHEVELTEGLQNYIKGIVWNVSTTFFNKMNNSGISFTGDFSSVIYNRPGEDLPEKEETDQEEEQTPYEIKLKEMYSVIRRYVFVNYVLTGKSLVRWRVFYLKMKGYTYPEICARVGVGYYSATQYNYLCSKEIKQQADFGQTLPQRILRA